MTRDAEVRGAHSTVRASQYPPGYVRRSIEDQIDFQARVFGLDPSHAFASCRHLPELPSGADGWFAVPKIQVVAKNISSALALPDRSLSREVLEAIGLAYALNLLKKERKLYDVLSLQDSAIRPTSHGLCTTSRTRNHLAAMGRSQIGDLLIIAAQLGAQHPGASGDNIVSSFGPGEFGLDAFSVACILLAHPERLQTMEKSLGMICVGSVMAKENPCYVAYDVMGKEDRSLALVPFVGCVTHESYGVVTGFTAR